MTNFLIGYSDLGFNSTTVTAPTIDIGQARNFYAGSRGEFCRRASAATSSAWVWEHPAPLMLDFLYLARADLIRRADSSGSTWTLEADDDGSFSAPDLDAATWELTDLLGPRSEDLLVEPKGIPAHLFFRLTIDTTESFKHIFTKMIAGSWLDLGREPLYPARVKRETTVPMPRAVPWSFDLEWRGITDAALSSLSDRVLKYRDVNPVILYDAADLVFAGSIKVVHAFVTDVQITPEWPGVNSVSLTFTEAI
jgi:hypothetical protein